jgi:uncharacterized membrane protein
LRTLKLGALRKAGRLSGASTLALLTMILVYVGYVGWRSFYAYDNFNSAYDAAVFNSSFWNSVHGNGLFYNSLEGGSHFGIHFSPLMILLLPVYWICPDYRVLLGSETLWMAAGIPAVYLIGKRHLPRRSSLSIALLYTLSPLVQGINLVNGEGFHPIAFSKTSFLYLFYFLDKGNHKGCLLFLVLALSCREDVALVGHSSGSIS